LHQLLGFTAVIWNSEIATGMCFNGIGFLHNYAIFVTLT